MCSGRVLFSLYLALLCHDVHIVLPSPTGRLAKPIKLQSESMHFALQNPWFCEPICSILQAKMQHIALQGQFCRGAEKIVTKSNHKVTNRKFGAKQKGLHFSVSPLYASFKLYSFIYRIQIGCKYVFNKPIKPLHITCIQNTKLYIIQLRIVYCLYQWRGEGFAIRGHRFSVSIANIVLLCIYCMAKYAPSRCK